MRVLVDALSGGMGGGLTVISSQLRALQHIRPEIHLRVLATPALAGRLAPTIASEVVTFSQTPTALRTMYEQFLMPWRQGDDFDVIYCPGNFCPTLVPVGPGLVVAQQNAHYFGAGRARRMPHGYFRKRIETWLAHRSVRRADIVVVVSRYLLDEMSREGLPVDHAYVLKPGVEDWPPPDTTFVPDWDFFLSVGQDYPHKRLHEVVLAWSRSVNVRASGLVLVGRVTARRQRELAGLVPAERRHKLRFSETGDRGRLRALFESAIATVSASELEASPLVDVEAGSLGCPLILADIPAHREVAGSRADYFPVGDIGSLESLLVAHERTPRAREPWPEVPTWEENARQLADLLRRSVP